MISWLCSITPLIIRWFSQNKLFLSLILNSFNFLDINKQTLHVLLQNNDNIIMFWQLQATDPDIGELGRVSYAIRATNNNAMPFAVDSIEGSIRPLQEFTSDEETQYRFTAIANDGGTPSRSTETNVIVGHDFIGLQYHCTAVCCNDCVHSYLKFEHLPWLIQWNIFTLIIRIKKSTLNITRVVINRTFVILYYVYLNNTVDC